MSAARARLPLRDRMLAALALAVLATGCEILTHPDGDGLHRPARAALLPPDACPRRPAPDIGPADGKARNFRVSPPG